MDLVAMCDSLGRLRQQASIHVVHSDGRTLPADLYRTATHGLARHVILLLTPLPLLPLLLLLLLPSLQSQVQVLVRGARVRWCQAWLSSVWQHMHAGPHACHVLAATCSMCDTRIIICMLAQLVPGATFQSVKA
jgi:hypothetical protein